MNITFDTSSTGPREAKALIVFLSALLPDSHIQITGVSAQAPLSTSDPTPPTGPTPVPAASSSEPEASSPESTPAKGRRRTKAEQGHPEEAEAILQEAGPVATAKPTIADELRALLNGYIQKHSMEDAIAILKEFGCNRVSEALTLEPAKLSALAEKLKA